MFALTRFSIGTFFPAGGAGLGRFAEIAILTVMAMIERGRQRAALSELDDRLLDDIGVSHAAAMREVDKPFWQA